jgi:2-polyprenyl-3-methyl-5-hydroxy-6-metoxy-1,4-benzoquinol methylase
MSGSQAFLDTHTYRRPGLRNAHAYLLPKLLSVAGSLAPRSRILDVGCGNGSVASEFAKLGYSVVGIDLSKAGIGIARESCPEGRFEVLAADGDVLANLGEEPFDLVYSAEVIEHLYDPRSLLRGCYAATKAGSRFICTTPYHGYWKNLAIALADGWDMHTRPLFDGGHIKFFSRKTLSALMTEVGFQGLKFYGAGRLPYLWKSMVMEGTKP